MNFDLSEEQKMLAEQVRRLLLAQASPARLRSLIGAGEEWDDRVWRELAALGVLGASIPEAYGGLGLSALDLAVVSEELGRANAAVPFFSSIVLAANAILMTGSAAQKTTYLPPLASGARIATFAYAEGTGAWLSPRCQFEDGRLNGLKQPVADAGAASLAVVLAAGRTGPCLVLVDLAADGVTRTKLKSFDELRAHYALHFDNAPASALEGGDVTRVLDRLFDRAAIQAAFEAVGGAQACLDMARGYVMERRIFGRPLGGYQAVKHKLADMLVRIELARSSAYYAGWAEVNEAAELPQAAAAARLMALDAFARAARENLQLHGGIGYTFEANCHFYYRRERTLALSLGARARWSERLIAALRPEAPARQVA